MLTYKIRKTSQKEFNDKMPYVTSSMLEAVNTCPRWGVVHSVLGKRFTTKYRQMALEAGSLMHDVFCCLNLVQVGAVQALPDHMHYHARQEFGKVRWENIWKAACGKKGVFSLDDIKCLERLVLACINSSEFYDDPNDKNRTLANLELCALELVTYWLAKLKTFPIYIEDIKDPTKSIGIEKSLDCVFDILKDDKSVTSIRTIGLADAVYRNPETGNIALGEYKTSAMMNEAWVKAYDTRHQLTLYNAQLQAYFGEQDKFNTVMIGSAIPVRTTSAPVRHFTVNRDKENVDQLILMMLHTYEQIEKFRNNALYAPMFTHSCNRFFRSCSLMDLCVASAEDREEMFDNMEITKEKSPSEEKAFLRNM